MALCIGAVELGILPRVAVPVSDRELREHGAQAAALADVLELRADQFDDPAPDTLAAAVRRCQALDRPALVTVRDPAEGGRRAIADADRIALYRAALEAGAAAVDIELRSPIREAVLREARRHGAAVLLSLHEFGYTPAREALAAAVERAREAGADIAKLACLARSAGDLGRLLDVLRARADAHLIVIGMGEHGRASRVFFPLVGSLLTYGCLAGANAPGQLTAAELVSELERYHPGFREARRR